jgi:NAD(P)-dependent dehydrogenase (short-subunit alcohol dehydrogenase family)
MATGVGGKNMIDYDPDLWDRVMTVNVKGTWLVTRAAVPLLREGAGSSTSPRIPRCGARRG